jgi:4-nitrophenyl phosphatase
MIKGVIFDLDGTLYYGNELAHDAQTALETLRQNQIDIFYITNNSTKSRDEITQKLVSLGVPATLDKVYCSASASVQFLLKRSLRKIFVIGSKNLEREVLSVGLELSNPLECECILVGMDFDITYEKISDALTALENGALFVACNIDANFVIENNIMKPGCGAMVGAIVGASRRNPDIIIGKPEVNMITQLMHDWNFQTDELYMIGDTYESDVVMAKKCGIAYVQIINNVEDTLLNRRYEVHLNLCHGHEVKSLTEAINKVLEQQ